MTEGKDPEGPVLVSLRRQRAAAVQITARSETLAMMVTDIIDAVLAGEEDRAASAYLALAELVKLEVAAAEDRGRVSTLPADAAEMLNTSIAKSVRHLQHVQQLLRSRVG